MLARQIPETDYTKFEYLYDAYGAKLYGFILPYTESKEQAEDYMMQVFMQVWKDINYFDSNAEKKILAIVLSICKPALRRQKNQNLFSETI